MKRGADDLPFSGPGIDPSMLTKAIKCEQTKENSESRKPSYKTAKTQNPSTSSGTAQDSEDAESSTATSVSAIGKSTSVESQAEVDVLSDGQIKRESSSPSTRGEMVASVPSEPETSTTSPESELQKKCTEALRMADNVTDPGLPNLREELLKNPDGYCQARTRLLVFDYDGTLTPLVPDPSQAIASHDILTALAQLASVPQNAVWIVSGRERRFLENVFPVSSGIGLVAEHGAYHRLSNDTAWHGDKTPTEYAWWTTMLSRMEAFVTTVPGSHVEVKDLTLVWHYRANQIEGSIVAPAYRKLLEAMAARLGWSDCKISDGSCIIEIRPKIINKGFAVQSILAEMERTNGKLPEFLLCVGDDVTDEDMFAAVSVSKVLPQHRFCCKVYSDVSRGTSTHATYRAEGPEDVGKLIEWLAD